jgi:hypothetical protein
VSGKGSVKLMAPSAGYDASELLKQDRYIPVGRIAFFVNNKDTVGLQLGTAGDVADVDFAQYEEEWCSNYVTTSAPIPITDKPLLRRCDYVTVKPESNLYKALAGKTGTVYITTFNLLGGNGAFYRFIGSHQRELHVGLGGGKAGVAPEGVLFQDGSSTVKNTGVGKNFTIANFAWWDPNETKYLSMRPRRVSWPQYGSTVRTVATWGGGKASIVINNGPVVTGDMPESVAEGILYLGLSTMPRQGVVMTRRDDTYQIDGFIQDIAFIPGVAAGYGAKLTEGPGGPPGTQPARTQSKSTLVPVK